MNVSWRSTLSLLVFTALVISLYQNCSSYHDPSIFDGTNTSSSSSSSPSDVRLDSPNGVIDVGEYDKALSFGGECNLGLKKNHYIEIQLKNQSNIALPVREDSLCPEKGTNLSTDCYRAIQFRCEHGRYYVHLPLNCSAYQGQSSSLYRLVGQLVVIDDSGKEIRDNKAAFDRFFQIAWAAGACH